MRQGNVHYDEVPSARSYYLTRHHSAESPEFQFYLELVERGGDHTEDGLVEQDDEQGLQVGRVNGGQTEVHSACAEVCQEEECQTVVVRGLAQVRNSVDGG